MRNFKNLLVTGGCGFIGSNFIQYLFDQVGFGGRLINIDKLTYAGNPLNLENVVSKFKNQYIFAQGDITDAAFMDHIFQKYAIDSICHFAAESHVDRSIAQPDDFIQTNIVGTFNLLELCRKYQDQIEIFHHISTDEVYGSLGGLGLFTEDSPYQPNSPYSASKASSDHLVRAYHHTYDLPVTVSNCSNNYGPYQFPEKLIPLIILNAFSYKDLPVYGDGKNVRDWLYVTDHCIAIWQIMTEAACGTMYNVGGDNEMKNIQVVEIICDILDELVPKADHSSRQSLIKFVTDRPGHDRRYAIDFTKLRTDLDWHPRESFETGIKKTVEWYLKNQDWVRQVSSGDYRKWIESQYG